MNPTCQTCADWSGRICEGSGPYRFKLTGAGWTCPAHHTQVLGFAAFITQRFPVSGPGRGGRRRLAQALGIAEMRISHWATGHCVPTPAMAELIAEAMHLPADTIEEMILIDVRQRAEQVWRGENKPRATSRPTPASQ